MCYFPPEYADGPWWRRLLHKALKSHPSLNWWILDFLLEAGNSSFSINGGPMFVLRGEDLMRKLPIKLLIQSDAGHNRVPGPIHHFKIVAPE